uniref:Uncharacterized protein n=1 Tax=Rhizophora mucronata TaxID=61149 RepID=A0A2P2MYE2_RHIMU
MYYNEIHSTSRKTCSISIHTLHQ